MYSGLKDCPENSKRGQYKAQIIHAGKLEACPFFFLNFKGTPSQEEHKTIGKRGLSNQIDFPALSHLRKMTYQNFINSGIQQLLLPLPCKNGLTPPCLEN
jgi:hypothetical protein